MARSPMPVGTYGAINVVAVRPNRDGVVRYKASANFRDYGGTRKQVARWGDTAPRARRALQTVLAELVEGRDSGGASRGLTAASRFADAAEVWLAGVAVRRADTTVDQYRQRYESLVRPVLGELRLREITVPRLEAFMAGLQRRGLAIETLRNVRTVLTGVLGTACRHGALRTDPTRTMSRLDSQVMRRPVRALTAAERTALLATVDADERAVSRDLPDLFRFMLGTGCRVGEALAVRWCDVDLDIATVEINGNVVPVRGRGLVRHTGKTAAALRTVRLPEFLVTLLRMRYDPQIMPKQPIFANSKGTYRDPANVGKWIRQAREVAGYPWLTSHVLRKTAATILDEGGFGATQIADVLGHSNPALTQNVYLHRGGPSDAAASALDAALRPHTT